MRTNDTKDTVWYMMNDDALIKELDMEKFEEEFKLDDVEPKQAKPSMSSLAKPASQDNPAGPAAKAEEKKVTKLDSKRQMTVAFARRQIPKNFTDRDLVKAVNNLDTDVLKINEIELLQRMIPQDAEMEAYKQYDLGKNDPELLSDEDKTMRQFTYIERMKVKLDIMKFMTQFDEQVRVLRPQLDALTAASKSVRTSQKLKRILEIILALGNYMMSKKNGPVYGFQLKSLESLKITKTSNKKRHLLHYITDLVRTTEKYQDLVNFHTELKCTDKAALYDLDTMESEVKELEKGLNQTKTQLAHVAKALDSVNDRKGAGLAMPTQGGSQSEKEAQNERLQAFYDRCSECVSKIRTDFDNGKQLYKDCHEFYGEKVNPGLRVFFGYFVNFVKDWKTAQAETEKLRKLELQNQKRLEAGIAQQNQQVERRNRNNKANMPAVMNELGTALRARSPNSGSSQPSAEIISPDAVQNGTMEELLLQVRKPLQTNLNGAVRGRHRQSIGESLRND